MTAPAPEGWLLACCDLRARQVLEFVLGRGAAPSTSAALWTACARLSIVPPRLLEACAHPGATLPGTDPRELALAFAACAYPTRASHTDPLRLARRVDGFVRRWSALQVAGVDPHGGDGLLEQLAATLVPEVGLAPEEFLTLLDDLAGCPLPPDEPGDPCAPRSAGTELRTSAALHLTTWAAAFPDTVRYWRHDAGAVRLLRAWPVNLPSSYASDGHRGIRAAGVHTRAVERLQQLHPAVPVEHLHRLLGLERAAAEKAWSVGVEATAVEGEVLRFWELQKRRLASGFSYYGFRSHLITWWRSCLRTFPFRNKRTRLETPGPEPSLAPRPAVLDPLTLHAVREGYRLVRTTFFPRKERSPERIEALRSLLDEVWHRAILPEQTSEPVPHGTLREIEVQHGQSVDKMSRDLRLRLQAYRRARIEGQSNETIRNLQLDETPRRANANRRPFARASTLWPITTLARTVPRERTLLWAFACRAFLNPRVQPGQGDEWSFARFLAEAWWWINDPFFQPLLEASSARVDQRATVALKATEAPLGRLVADLRRSGEPAQRPRPDEPATTAARDQALGVLRTHVDGKDLRAFASPRAGIARHWIIPVLYLTHVEGLSEAQLLGRAAPDPAEEGAVAALARSMRAEVMLEV